MVQMVNFSSYYFTIYMVISPKAQFQNCYDKRDGEDSKTHRGGDTILRTFRPSRPFSTTVKQKI